MLDFLLFAWSRNIVAVSLTWPGGRDTRVGIDSLGVYVRARGLPEDCWRTAGGLLEDCQSTARGLPEDRWRAAQRIEEELLLAEEEVVLCLCLVLDFLCFARCFNDVFCYTHGQMVETTLLAFDLERGSVISRE